MLSDRPARGAVSLSEYTLHAGGVFPQNSFIDSVILRSRVICFEGNNIPERRQNSYYVIDSY